MFDHLRDHLRDAAQAEAMIHRRRHVELEIHLAKGLGPEQLVAAHHGDGQSRDRVLGEQFVEVGVPARHVEVLCRCLGLFRVDVADRNQLDAFLGQVAPGIQVVLRKETAADDRNANPIRHLSPPIFHDTWSADLSAVAADSARVS